LSPDSKSIPALTYLKSNSNYFNYIRNIATHSYQQRISPPNRQLYAKKKETSLPFSLDFPHKYEIQGKLEPQLFDMQ
jgi:hypothetical protein